VQPLPNFIRRRQILLVILTFVGIFGLTIRCAYLVVTSIYSTNHGSDNANFSNFLEALAMLFCASLLLPALIYSLKRLKGQEIPPGSIQLVKIWQVSALVVLWMIFLTAGALLVSLFPHGWAVAAPFFLLGISLPIFIIAWVSAGGLPVGSRQRLWSAFGFGMVGGSVASGLLEYLVVGLAALGVGVLAIAKPELRIIIDQVKSQVANTRAGDMQALLTVLAPYLTNPIVILAILFFAALLAPMIEEAVKPAVLWFLGKRLRSPAEGFVLGAFCGAGFATLEGFLAASGASEMWAFGLAGRAAASLMHITGSGIVGWGIASARLDKRYGRLVLSYLASVSIHGLWNGSAILAVYGALRMMLQNMQLDWLSTIFVVGGVGMLFLELVLMLAVLPLVNRSLRRSASPVIAAVQSDIIAPPQTSPERDTNELDFKSR